MATLVSAPRLTVMGPEVRKQSRPQSPLQVPSLPKLHGRGSLVTTKLCETLHKSTEGHAFDLSTPMECSSFREYNSLQDPHLKAYFYHPEMKRKLIKNGFITEELGVVCSLKEYNAYRNFLEREFTKQCKQEKEENERERRQKGEKNEKDYQRIQLKKEREAKRKQFFLQQEEKLQTRHLQLKQLHKQDEMARLKALEQKKIEREKNEIRREAEREKRRMDRMEREAVEARKKKQLLRHTEHKDFARMVHLHQIREEKRRKHLDELQQRWQAYEDHAEKVKRQEENEREKELAEKAKRMRRREKLFILLQNREEERKRKQKEENHHQVEMLKEQADRLEKKREDWKQLEVNEWHEKFQHQQEHWKHHVEHQKEVRKMETKKHVEELLHPHPPPSAAPKKPSRMKSVSRVTSTLSNCTSSVSVKDTKPTGSKPSENGKVVRKAVRFVTIPTVHIMEEEEMFREGEEDATVTVTSDCKISQSGTEGSKQEDEEEVVLHEVASKVVTKAINGAVQKVTPL